MNVPTIEINLATPCRECGEAGAAPNGLCLACTADKFEREALVAEGKEIVKKARRRMAVETAGKVEMQRQDRIVDTAELRYKALAARQVFRDLARKGTKAAKKVDEHETKAVVCPTQMMLFDDLDEARMSEEIETVERLAAAARLAKCALEATTPAIALRAFEAAKAVVEKSR